jgi:hypothetical protein
VAAAATGHLSVGGIVSQVIAGGAGGAILTAIVGAIKNKPSQFQVTFFVNDRPMGVYSTLSQR